MKRPLLSARRLLSPVYWIGVLSLSCATATPPLRSSELGATEPRTPQELPDASNSEFPALSAGVVPPTNPPRARFSAVEQNPNIAGEDGEADPDDPTAVHDDVPEEDPSTFAQGSQLKRPHPYDALSEKTLEQWLLHSPEKLGALSIGRPNGGALMNGVRFPESDFYTLVAPGTAWASEETVTYLTRSLARVHEAFPDAPKLFIGDVSAQSGGHLSPHLSHQAGRDIDISYFYIAGAKWYATANALNLDVEKTWAFIRALTLESDVEMILIDASIQGLLKPYALKCGDDPVWVEDLFRGTLGVRPALIRHVRGHRTHLHIRFYNPDAQESAHRLQPLLVKYNKVKPRVYTVSYTAKKKDTFKSIAARFGISVSTLMAANNGRYLDIGKGKRVRLINKSKVLYAKAVYLIPRAGTLPSPEVIIPARRLPNMAPNSATPNSMNPGLGTRHPSTG